MKREGLETEREGEGGASRRAPCESVSTLLSLVDVIERALCGLMPCVGCSSLGVERQTSDSDSGFLGFGLGPRKADRWHREPFYATLRSERRRAPERPNAGVGASAVKPTTRHAVHRARHTYHPCLGSIYCAVMASRGALRRGLAAAGGLVSGAISAPVKGSASNGRTHRWVAGATLPRCRATSMRTHHVGNPRSAFRCRVGSSRLARLSPPSRVPLPFLDGDLLHEAAPNKYLLFWCGDSA